VRGTVPVSPESVGTGTLRTPVNYAYAQRAANGMSSLAKDLAGCVETFFFSDKLQVTESQGYSKVKGQSVRKLCIDVSNSASSYWDL